MYIHIIFFQHERNRYGLDRLVTIHPPSLSGRRDNRKVYNGEV